MSTDVAAVITVSRFVNPAIAITTELGMKFVKLVEVNVPVNPTTPDWTVTNAHRDSIISQNANVSRFEIMEGRGAGQGVLGGGRWQGRERGFQLHLTAWSLIKEL